MPSRGEDHRFYELVDRACSLTDDPGTRGLLRAASYHEATQTGEEVATSLLGVKKDERPPRGSWAPGDYLCNCFRCGTTFIGDKRAGNCSNCAYRDALPCGCNDPETCEDRDANCPPTVKP